MAERPYHHGDLRETLLEAALVSIDAHGTEKLSLRALARQAGVSAAAPYRHFPSKRCLLAALMTRGFRALEDAVRRGSEAAGDDPAARLLGAGMGYLEFARDNPTSYRLMFDSVIGDFSDYEDVKRSSESAYEVVLDILEAMLARPGSPPLTVSQAGGVVWAAVHGISSLQLFARERLQEPAAGGPQRSLADLDGDPCAALELLLAGLAPAAGKSERGAG